MLHGLPQLRRAQTFPDAACCKIALSNSISVSKRFSREFTFSRSSIDIGERATVAGVRELDSSGVDVGREVDVCLVLVLIDPSLGRAIAVTDIDTSIGAIHRLARGHGRFGCGRLRMLPIFITVWQHSEYVALLQ